MNDPALFLVLDTPSFPRFPLEQSRELIQHAEIFRDVSRGLQGDPYVVDWIWRRLSVMRANDKRFVARDGQGAMPPSVQS